MDGKPIVIATPEPELTGCRDGCGQQVLNPEQAGWSFLEIIRQWRCPSCNRTTEAFKAQQENDNDSTQ